MVAVDAVGSQNVPGVDDSRATCTVSQPEASERYRLRQRRRHDDDDDDDGSHAVQPRREARPSSTSRQSTTAGIDATDRPCTQLASIRPDLIDPALANSDKQTSEGSEHTWGHVEPVIAEMRGLDCRVKGSQGLDRGRVSRPSHPQPASDRYRLRGRTHGFVDADDDHATLFALIDAAGLTVGDDVTAAKRRRESLRNYREEEEQDIKPDVTAKRRRGRPRKFADARAAASVDVRRRGRPREYDVSSNVDKDVKPTVGLGTTLHRRRRRRKRNWSRQKTRTTKHSVEVEGKIVCSRLEAQGDIKPNLSSLGVASAVDSEDVKPVIVNRQRRQRRRNYGITNDREDITTPSNAIGGRKGRKLPKESRLEDRKRKKTDGDAAMVYTEQDVKPNISLSESNENGIVAAAVGVSAMSQSAILGTVLATNEDFNDVKPKIVGRPERNRKRRKLWKNSRKCHKSKAGGKRSVEVGGQMTCTGSEEVRLLSIRNKFMYYILCKPVFTLCLKKPDPCYIFK